MLRFLLQLILNAVVLTGLSEVFWPHAYISSFGTAVVLAIVLMILYRIVYPILRFISFPITLLTLGLFRIVLNGIIFAIADAIMGRAVYMESFGYTMLFALLYGIIQWGIQRLVEPHYYDRF
ncbi:MAG: phage holin family protein [Aerococcus sp.]|nr:phage holin family protein [Aerococcus sp.]